MILIPMAGDSRRFREAGYSLPKFMLPLNAGYVFDYVLAGLQEVSTRQSLVFVSRVSHAARDFIAARCAIMGLQNITVVELNAPTHGQAETVELGLDTLRVKETEPLTIFNIDTFHRPIQSREVDVVGDGWLVTD